MPTRPPTWATLLALATLTHHTVTASPPPAVGRGVAYEVEGTSLAALSLDRPGGGAGAGEGTPTAPDWSANVDEGGEPAEWVAARSSPPPPPCASPTECRAACEGSGGSLADAGADAAEAAVRKSRGEVIFLLPPQA